jgi:hypothetical protein
MHADSGARPGPSGRLRAGPYPGRPLCGCRMPWRLTRAKPRATDAPPAAGGINTVSQDRYHQQPYRELFVDPGARTAPRAIGGLGRLKPPARSSYTERVGGDLLGGKSRQRHQARWPREVVEDRSGEKLGERAMIALIRRAASEIGRDLSPVRNAVHVEPPGRFARPEIPRADAGTRTPDPFITSEVLYQLSYVGATLNASGAATAPDVPPGDRPRHAGAPSRSYAAAPARASIAASSASSDSPCFSQKAGPMPRICSSASMLPGAARSTSSSTALAATVYAGFPSARS